ncbi:bifunctional metallophosphatase/5'-nucleotidase [Niallia sp. 01092]|uniref:bifunctional metallophosphatase/5'-nucleotidase n=1 Tax=unclassified Niallia TaxID=2837522 RepID=UPI003FD607E9
MEVIHIYHTNDLHSHFENWPKIFKLLRERKKWHEDAGDPVYVFDIGDHMDLCHPYTEATKGKINTELLERENYTAVTIGNNEGITLSYEALDSLYKTASFDVILANLYKADGDRPEWTTPYKIYTTTAGIKIGVIGITAYFDHLYELLGWKLTDPFHELEKQLSELKDNVDIIVVLSHLGINEDEEMAARFPEIDLILGAHTHHILHQGKLINNTLLGAAGKFGYFVGHIVLTVDPINKIIMDKQATLYETSKLAAPKDGEVYIENLYEQGKQELSTEVVTLAKKWSKEEIAKFLCKEIQYWCKADCAILNEGLILNDLQAGPVSYFDLLSICPHPINPCKVTLTGAELKEILLDLQDNKWEHFHLKGLGFRGKLMGKMISHGIKLETSGERNTYFLEKKELHADEKYTVAIPDMFTFGNFFPAIYRAKEKKYFLPEFMRNILAEKLSHH